MLSNILHAYCNCIMTNGKEMTISDVMTKSVISVDYTLTIGATAKMMEDAKVGSVIVMKNNVPSGIVTDRDFAVAVASHGYPLSASIEKIMSTPLISISSNDAIRFASDLMFEKRIRKLPVIDNDCVVGMITATDIVNLLAVSTEDDIRDMYFHSIVKIFSNYSPYN